MDREVFERRIIVLLTVIAGLLGVLALRLWQVQIIQGEYFLRLSEENRLRVTSVAAPRGLIVDRRGRPVVVNRPAFTVSLMPMELRRPHEEVAVVARLLGLDPAAVDQQLAEGRDRPFAPVRLRRDVPKEIIAAIEESRMDLPGVLVEVEPVRQYPYKDLAAHLLGYIGEINDRELRQLRAQGYEAGELIGKEGAERTYDRYLRGRNGEIQAEVDALGRPLRTLGTIPAVAGVSTFSNLSISKAGVGYTLTATAAPLPVVTSPAFNIN